MKRLKMHVGIGVTQVFPLQASLSLDFLFCKLGT